MKKYKFHSTVTLFYHAVQSTIYCLRPLIVINPLSDDILKAIQSHHGFFLVKYVDAKGVTCG